MTALAPLLGRRAVVDYARRPLNLGLLVLVPAVLVWVWGGTLADFANLLGGTGDQRQVEAATAGWAAAALAGLAGFFQTVGGRGADRRLAGIVGRARPIVGGRLGASVLLALVAAAGGLVALAIRAGINDPVRATAATVLIAVMYLAIGATVGTLVKSEMNGALVVTLIWIFDVFLGPALGPGTALATRILPLHFPTLVLIGQTTEHGGPVGDIGWTAIWAVVLVSVAVHRVATTIRPAPRPAERRRHPVPVDEAAGAVTSEPTPAAIVPTLRTESRLRAVVRAGLRDHRRNRVLWVLLVTIPALFIGLAVLTTVDMPGPVDVVEGGRRFTLLLSERRMHAATMVPITAAFLAGITGLFVVTGSAEPDRRLVLAGFRCRQVLTGRLAVIVAATVLTTGISVAFSGVLYAPGQWLSFTLTNLLIALTYAMLGVLLGPLTGRLGGLYLLLLLAFLDVGLGQTVMLPGGPPDWGAYLPARGAFTVMIDAAFTSSFDGAASIVLAGGWLSLFLAVTAGVFHHRNRVVRLSQGAK